MNGSVPAVRATLPAGIDPEAPAIAIIGDLQLTPAFVRRFRGREDNRLAQQRLFDDLRARVGDLGGLVIVGDLVFSARSRRDWRHFDSLVGPIAASVPVLPAIGNHDYHCLFIQLCWQSVVPKQFRERFPWMRPAEPYSVPYGSLILVFLDSETGIAEQAAWLERNLADFADEYEMALIFFHRPAFSNSIDLGAHGDEQIQALITPILDGAAIPGVVFSGHVHGYERIVEAGTQYVTTAGGGGPRGLLGPARPGDAYLGRDCLVDESGAVLRPLNYAILSPAPTGIEVEVRGFCDASEPIGVLETFAIPFPRSGRAVP